MFIANDWQTGLLPVYMAGRPKHQHHQLRPVIWERGSSAQSLWKLQRRPLHVRLQPQNWWHYMTFKTLKTFKTFKTLKTLKTLRHLWNWCCIDAALMHMRLGCWMLDFNIHVHEIHSLFTWELDVSFFSETRHQVIHNLGYQGCYPLRLGLPGTMWGAKL